MSLTSSKVVEPPVVDALVSAAGVTERVFRKRCSRLFRKREAVAEAILAVMEGCVDVLEGGQQLNGVFAALVGCIEGEEAAFLSLMESTDLVLLRKGDVASALKEQDGMWRAAWAARERGWRATAAAPRAACGRCEREGAGPRTGVDASTQCGDSCGGEGVSLGRCLDEVLASVPGLMDERAALLRQLGEVESRVAAQRGILLRARAVIDEGLGALSPLPRSDVPRGTPVPSTDEGTGDTDETSGGIISPSRSPEAAPGGSGRRRGGRRARSPAIAVLPGRAPVGDLPDLLRRARRGVTPEDFGLLNLRSRPMSSQPGVILAYKAAPDADPDAFVRALRSTMTGAEVFRLRRRGRICLRGLGPHISRGEVLSALAAAGGCSAAEFDVGPIQGPKVVVSASPALVGRICSQGSLRVGWARVAVSRADHASVASPRCFPACDTPKSSSPRREDKSSPGGAVRKKAGEGTLDGADAPDTPLSSAEEV